PFSPSPIPLWERVGVRVRDGPLTLQKCHVSSGSPFSARLHLITCRRLTSAHVILIAVLVAIASCSRLTRRHGGPLETATASAPSPFGGAPTVDIPDDARAMGAFLKAEVATNEGDRDEALGSYEEAVKYDPENATLRVSLATMYVREGRLKDALREVNKGIQIKPDSADALVLAAGISSALGDDGTAENDYQAALRTEPRNQEAYLYLG